MNASEAIAYKFRTRPTWLFIRAPWPSDNRILFLPRDNVRFSDRGLLIHWWTRMKAENSITRYKYKYNRCRFFDPCFTQSDGLSRMVMTSWTDLRDFASLDDISQSRIRQYFNIVSRKLRFCPTPSWCVMALLRQLFTRVVGLIKWKNNVFCFNAL